MLSPRLQAGSSFASKWLLPWTNTSLATSSTESATRDGSGERAVAFGTATTLLAGGQLLSLLFFSLTASEQDGPRPILRNICFDVSIVGLSLLRRLWIDNNFSVSAIIPQQLRFYGSTIPALILLSILAIAILAYRYADGRSWITEGGLILPCETYHKRSKPKKHEFKYSYLFIWVPVWTKEKEEERCKDGGRYWMFADARDHLYRGDGRPEQLQTKLERYLRDEGLDPAEYTEAYLVTAPTLLGHQFNPVSFWYLFKDDELAAMVLEVNNTFDERRMYLLERSGKSEQPNTSPSQFRHTFAKDFHVSPFNSRKGSYKLDAANPFLAGSRKNPQIDNRITLVSSDGEFKFFARVCSLAKAVDPVKNSPWKVRRFMARWWWTGKVTYLRIVREAFKLFFLRKLHVWFRPEVKPTSIGRQPTAAELRLERAFRTLLETTVRQSKSEIAVEYNSVSEDGTRMLRFGSLKESKSQQILRIDVLSPEFFTRIVRYEDVLEGLLTETAWDTSQELSPLAQQCRSQLDPKIVDVYDNKTLSISSVNLLVKLFADAQYASPSTKLSPFGRAALVFGGMLQNKAKFRDASIMRRLYALDKVALSDPSLVPTYTKDALSSIVAARIAFGDPTLLWVMSLMVRVSVLWHIAQFFGSASHFGTLGSVLWNIVMAAPLLAAEVVWACI